jgi:MFS family permease
MGVMTNPDDVSSTSLPRNVRLLGFSSLVNDVASEMIYPLMPQFLLGVLGGNKLHLGIIEGVADSTASLLKLWSGAWSDRAGRRKGFIVFGYALAAAARPMISIATAPWHLFAARTADRIGKGVRAAPRDALVADSTPPELRGRAFGFNRAMDHLGAAIGPLLASAFLLAWPNQLRLLFLLTIVPGLAVVTLVALGLKEIPADALPPPEPAAQARGRTRKAPPHLSLAPLGRDFRWFLAALALFTLGNASDAFLLVRASELGVSTAMLPILWCAFHVVKSTGSLVAGRAVDRLGPRPLILVGWFVYAAVYLAFAMATQAWQIWALFLTYGVFFALTEPAERTLAAVLAGDQQKGLAYGWFNFAIGVAALPASLLFGAIYQRFGPVAAFGWGAGLALLAAVVLAGIRQR